MRTTMPHRTGRPLAVWVLALALSCAAGVFAWRFFPVALPIVSLDIRMDRSAALAEAERLAIQRGWGPPAADARQSARFGSDGRLQAFVEREAGGKDAFLALTRNALVSPYAWEVRRFAAGDAREVTVAFRPDGSPHGFSDHLPDAAPGAAIDADRARAIAERAAATEWQVDLSRYRAVETASRTQPGKRVDHTFTYEHSSARVGAAPIRLRLVVGGDRLTALERFVRVPEDFDRRYAAMRTGNDTIAGIAAMVIGVVLLVGGVGGGLLLLLRRGAARWQPAIVLGLVIGGLQLIAGLAAYPLIWQDYDTALQRSSFIGRWLFGVVVESGGTATLLTVTFVAAEGLTRLAFAGHPQLWATWSRAAAASPEVARRTAVGYLMVPIDLAYVVGLYFFTTRVLGWWSPSDTLVDPNILASWLPWSAPVANALQAGIWEECLFRAVPLAGGALIGQRFGRRGLGILIAMVLQTAIFGAGHANYPGSPAYARPVELIIPSLVFGVLYLRLGLLPGIILHSAYDLVLMALPVFAASSPRLWDDRAIVAAVLLTPALVVAWHRARAGAWVPLPDSLRNGQPVPHAVTAEPVADEPVRDIGHLSRWVVPVALLLALVGGGLGLLGLSRRPMTAVRLTAARPAVERAARAALDARGAPRDGWRLSSSVEDTSPGLAHAFVLDTAGRDVHARLLGDWLPLPAWRARLARFDGAVEARAEEWDVRLDGDGRARQVTHRLPESAAGATLTDVQARALARAAVEQHEGMRVDDVTEVAATPRRLPHRTDWSFTWRLTSSPLAQGELRYSAMVAGDAVVSTARSVYIPEQWLRARRERSATRGIVAALGAMPASLLVFFAMGAAVVAWARGWLSGRLVLLFGVLQAVVGALALLQSWPSVLDGLSTTRPVALQILAALGGGLVGAVMSAGALALPLGVVPAWMRRRVIADERQALWTGLAIGLAWAPVPLVLSLIRTDGPAFVGQTAFADAWLPWLQPAVTALQRVALAALPMIAVSAVNRVTRDWTRHRWLAGALVAGSAAMIAPAAGLEGVVGIVGAIAAAMLALALYVRVLRHDVTLVVLIVGVGVVIDLLQMGARGPFPGARVGAAMAIPVVVLTTGWLWRQARRLVAG